MSDVLAFPSIWEEPFGMTVVEAMATGLPVVAFDRGGPKEIIRHGADGLLVPFEKGANGFAEALLKLARDANYRETLGRAARQTVEKRFTWNTVMEEFLRLCR